MEGLVWLLFLAGMFFLMMRFGCGAHMVHGRGGHHAAGRAAEKDPVCGTPVEAGKGYTKSHAGIDYWFCSRNCLDSFEADPQKYLVPNAEEETT